MAKIWVDLDNSPHVPFFAPIIRELESRGHLVWVTARDRYQVHELAEMHGIRHCMVGRDYGKNKVVKTAGLCWRALQLCGPASEAKPDLALSHGSRSQILSCQILKIPSVLIIDYEHSKNFPFIRYDNIFIPDVIPESAVRARCNCIWKYPGIKEDVYVPGYRPKEETLQSLGIASEKILVTLRPPAVNAHYHNPEGERLCNDIIAWIGSEPNAVTVLLPRYDNQRKDFIRLWSHLISAGKLVIPEKVLDGLDLIWHSDLVISGGGTMNREAAALGVPVYSIFKGELGQVDRYLSATGRMLMIEDPAMARAKIRLEKRYRQQGSLCLANRTLCSIVDRVEATLKKSG